MRLATIATDSGTRAVKAIEHDGAPALLDLGFPDVRSLLGPPGALAAAATATGGEIYDAATARFAPVVADPGKVVCATHNYPEHLTILGLHRPQFLKLATKFASSLLGPADDIAVPRDAHALEPNVELAVIIGSPVRRASTDEAAAAIAGFTVINDVVDNDFSFEMDQWATGNAWDGSTPIGPYLVTPDELPGGVRPDLGMTTLLDGTPIQSGRTAEALLDPVELVVRVSRLTALAPGDIIATGTPSAPSRTHGEAAHLLPGREVIARIEHLGETHNRILSG